MGNLRTRAIRSALGCAVLTLMTNPMHVWAATATSSGANRCTISARAPRLDVATNTLRGWSAVSCTMSTVVGVDSLVVEMDGNTESATAVRETRWVVVNGNTVTVVLTSRGTCLNTEPGNEEYATKARVLLGATVSVWDRTVPDPDSYNC